MLLIGRGEAMLAGRCEHKEEKVYRSILISISCNGILSGKYISLFEVCKCAVTSDKLLFVKFYVIGKAGKELFGRLPGIDAQMHQLCSSLFVHLPKEEETPLCIRIKSAPSLFGCFNQLHHGFVYRCDIVPLFFEPGDDIPKLRRGKIEGLGAMIDRYVVVDKKKCQKPKYNFLIEYKTLIFRCD